MPTSPLAPLRRHVLFFWVVATLAPLCTALYVFGTLVLVRYGNYEQSFGWTAALTRHGLVVASVESHTSADGKLSPGDEVVSVSAGVIPPAGYFRRLAPRDGTYSVRVRRNDLQDVDLRAPVVYTGKRLAWLAIFLSGVSFGGVGLFLGLVRPDLAVARLFGVAFTLTAFLQFESAFDAIANQLPRAEQIMYGAFSLSVGVANAMVYHAITRLPGPPPPRWAWPRLGVVMYVVGVAALVTYGIPSVWLWWTNADEASRLLFARSAWFSLGGPTRTLVELLSAVGVIWVFGWKLAYVRDPEERRRLRWFLAGCIVAIVPFALYKVLQAASLSNDPAALRNSPLRTIGNGALTFAPLSLAYAITKHQILDITVVIRRGVKYVLARNALTLVLLIPSLGVVYTIFVNQNRTIKETLFETPAYLGLIVVAVLALRFRQTVTERIDRLFFREAYDRERVLRSLFDDLDRLGHGVDVTSKVTQELERALHPEHLYLFLREGAKDVFSVAHARVDVAVRAVSLDPSALDALERNPRARESSSGSWTDTDRKWLNVLHVDLVVPMVATEGWLSGLLLLGPKKSEEPYTAGDRELLDAIAKQSAVVLENLRLKERIDRDRVIRHQVVQRLETRAINLLKECPRCGACYDGVADTCVVDGQELAMSLPVERIIDGQYRLDQLIGKGGMGVVYEAQDVRLKRTVAIKLLLGAAFGESTALRRFDREARLCARLNHPNIVTVFDYGTLSGAGAYLAMERLSGETLRERSNRVGALPPAAAADIFEQILEAVKAAHAGGVVHRDLKPENVFLCGGDGRTNVKLLDFGLAQVRTVDSSVTVTANVTAAGQVLGTLNYMAPEQLLGTPADERADIFAIGVMVVEVLTRKLPFDRSSYAVALASRQSAVTHLPETVTAYRTLSFVLQRCLASEPAARLGSAAALQRELIPALLACGSLPIALA